MKIMLYHRLLYSTQTVWKFRNSTTTQILREIKSYDLRSSKYTILAILEGLKFDFDEFLQF